MFIEGVMVDGVYAVIGFVLGFFTVFAGSAGAAPASQPAADWSRRPSKQWPQIVLTNEASFEGHSSLHGASSFLMKMPDGEVVVGTAKHLIKKPGGVEPPIPLPQLDQVLTNWKVFPRTHADRSVEAKGVVERTNGESHHDWLLLHLVKAPSALPATPLVPRAEPVRVGETLYLIGVPYSDRHSAQNVYAGVVTGRPGEHYFTYEFKPPVHIAGFSGAPIVDANGLLVGHGVSMTPGLKQQNGMEIEFGGEDACLALQLWKHRNDAPAAHPADVLHVELPAGWTAKKSRLANAIQFAEYPQLTAFFDLLGEPRADFADDHDLARWAAAVKLNSAKGTTLSDRQETDLKSGMIAGRPTMEYEITGAIKGVSLHYRIIMLEHNGCYCKLVFWTTPGHWDEAQPKFEDVVKSLK